MKSIALSFALAAAFISLQGCSAVRATGDSVEAVGDGAGYAVSEAGRGIGNAVSGTGRAVSRAADSD